MSIQVTQDRLPDGLSYTDVGAGLVGIQYPLNHTGGLTTTRASAIVLARAQLLGFFIDAVPTVAAQQCVIKNAAANVTFLTIDVDTTATVGYFVPWWDNSATITGYAVTAANEPIINMFGVRTEGLRMEDGFSVTLENAGGNDLAVRLLWRQI